VSWLARWRAWREQRLIDRHPIPDALWQATLARYPFLPDAARLRAMSSLFLATREFHGAGGLVVTDAMAVAVAAQACLPVMHLGLGAYGPTRGIVMHPGEVLAPREDVDEHGVVHQWEEPLAGEAMPGGPLMLTWDAVDWQDDGGPVFNVVIHEFVHLIDLGNGESDGLPPLPSAEASRAWLEGLTAAWDRFADRVAHREPSCIDDYGTEALDEFFAVAAEAFFVDPEALRAEDPALHRQLADYFQPA
jgi:Mlc titration factor MtfA (ptsG expression regulator)